MIFPTQDTNVCFLYCSFSSGCEEGEEEKGTIELDKRTYKGGHGSSPNDEFLESSTVVSSQTGTHPLNTSIYRYETEVQFTAKIVL